MFPLTPAAEEALKELDFPIIDAHHHIWGDCTTPRAQCMMAEVDFPALGLQPLTPPKKIPAGFKPPPSMPIEAVKGMIKGIEASFGTHQVLLQDYNPEDLQADFAEAKGVKVAATVHLECGWLDGTKDGETKYIQKIADETNQIGKAIVGTVDMLEPDVSKTEALLRKHMESQNFRGIRMSIAHDPTDKQLPHAPEPDITKNPNFLANLELFRPSKLDLEYDLWAYGHQLPSLVELAKKFPDVRFILNHYSTPLYIGNDDAAFEEWKTNIKALADASPNVYAKLSGLMAMLGLDFGIYKQTWPNAGPSAETIASSRFGEMTKHVIESFGTDRCVFGSNFPVDKGMARYGELLASFVINAKEAGAGKEELKKMFHDNAKRFYRIECC